MTTTEATDLGVGLALLLGILAVTGALLSFVVPGTVAAAWGFAAAVTFGALAVAAIHVYS